MKLTFVPKQEIERVRKEIADPVKSSRILADIFRLNTLSMIMQAGSGHLGTSFSCMDILTWIWTQVKSKDDTFFSSKGHDVPALYSVLAGLGYLDFDLIHKLRRIGGLPGHPDIHTPYIAANTGSLGMGVSKARGMAHANRLNGKSGRFYVLTGDGELQEGQFWESLLPVANRKMAEITVIVDHNKLQSDIEVAHVSDLGNLEERFRVHGWEVFRINGHDFDEIKAALEKAQQLTDKPQVIIADTIKGKGSKISEASKHTKENELYNFHAGAPSLENYQKILKEILVRIPEVNSEEIEVPDRLPISSNVQKLIPAYGEELVKLGTENKDIVVLDGDLMKDTGLIPFKEKFPERFLECGIAEQDMVSVAGGLALRGKLPIVHSFACFLSTRPNEQIYNNATEETKIIYSGSLAGLLPAAPGHSHQCVRDISSLGSIPGLTLIEPSCEQETRLALRWAVEKNPKSTYLRIASIQIETNFALPNDYRLEIGRGVRLTDGPDAILFTYGPVMLTEAVKAASVLKQQGFGLAVYNLPWLNEIDKDWLKEVTKDYTKVFTLDDHYIKLGQGSMVAGALGKEVVSLGLTRVPESGQAEEILKFHNLDAESIARQIHGKRD